MTHSPPVPPGNQSPYPLHEAPHPPAPPQPAAAPAAMRDAIPTGAIVGALAAIGIGAAVTAALWAWSGRSAAAGSRKRQPAAKRKPARRRTTRAKASAKG